MFYNTGNTVQTLPEAQRTQGIESILLTLQLELSLQLKRIPLALVPSLANCMWFRLRVTTRAHNLCHDNRQLIVLAINCNHSASKNNCN